MPSRPVDAVAVSTAAPRGGTDVAGTVARPDVAAPGTAPLGSLLGGNLTAIGTLLLLLSTQVFLKIPNGVSVGGYRSLNLAEVPLLLLTAWVAWQLVARGGWRRLTRLGRTVLVLTLVSGLVWAAMVVLRRLVTGRMVVSITPIEYLVFGVAVFLTTELGRLRSRQIIIGVAAFLTATNLYAVVTVLLGGTIREMGLLGNINYYVGVALMLIPVLTIHAARTTSRAMRWLVIANLGVLFSIVVLSGSRFGGLAAIAMLAATAVFVHPGSLRTRALHVGAALGIAVLTFATLVLANPHQLSDVGRTFNIMSVLRGEEPDTAEIEQKHRDNPQPPPVASEQDRFTTAGDPDHDPYPEGLNILNHTRVTTRSLAVYDENWLMGTGRTGPYFAGWGYHPAHNIVLELALYLGTFGALPWLAILLSGFVGAWRAGDRKAWVLGYAGLFCFAMLQPLLSEALITLLPMWLLLGAARNHLLHREEAPGGATAVDRFVLGAKEVRA